MGVTNYLLTGMILQVSPKVSGKDAGFLYLISLFLGVGFPLHKPYPYILLGLRIPPFLAHESFDDPHDTTLPKLNIAPEKLSGPNRKPDRLPSTIFQWRTDKLRGCIKKSYPQRIPQEKLWPWSFHQAIHPWFPQHQAPTAVPSFQEISSRSVFSFQNHGGYPLVN